MVWIFVILFYCHSYNIQIIIDDNDPLAAQFQANSIAIPYSDFLVKEISQADINFVATTNPLHSYNALRRIGTLRKIIIELCPFYLDNPQFLRLPSKTSNAGDSVTAFLNYFQIEGRSAIFTDSTIQNLDLALIVKKYLQNSEVLQLNKLSLVNKKTMKDEVLFKVKPGGFKIIFCFANELYCKNLNDALRESKLEKVGQFFLAANLSCSGIDMVGSFCVQQYLNHPLNQVNTQRFDDFQIFKDVIDFIVSQDICNEVLVDCIQTEIEKRIAQITKHEGYSIWNLKAEGWVQVGKWEDQALEMIEDSVFIGNTINVPNNELYKIKITGNIDPLEPDGTTEIVTKHNSAIYEWIVNDINNRLDYLEFFKLEMNYIDGCGVLQTNRQIMENCIKSANRDFGIAWVFNWYQYQIYDLQDIIKEQNLEFVLICAYDGSTVFGSRQQYPLYASMIPDNEEFYNLHARMFLGLGWRKMLLIVSYFNFEQRLILLRYAEQYNLMIENAETSLTPTGLTKWQDYEDFHPEYIDAIVQAESRIIVENDSYFEFWYIPMCLIERGYQSHYITVVPFMYRPFFIAFDPEKLTKYFNGSITQTRREWEAERCQELKQHLIEVNGAYPSHVQCALANGMLLLIEALDFATRRGLDYDNPYIIRELMSSVVAIGCSTTLRIQQNLNNLYEPQLMYKSMMFDSQYQPQITPFFTYSPFNSRIFDFVEDFQHVWPTGSKEIPTDVPRYSHECFYEDEGKIQRGQINSFAAVASVIILLIIFAILFFKSIDRAFKADLETKTLILWQDILIYSGMIVESVQQIACLYIGHLYIGVKLLILLFGLSYDKDSIRNGVEIWTLMKIIFSFITLWIIFSIFCYFFLVKRKRIFYVFARIGETLLPLGSQILFIPALKGLLLHFLCFEGSGEDELNLYQNCDIPCWDDEFKWYFSVSIVLIIVYGLVSIYCALNFNRFRFYIRNLYAQPTFVFVKIIYKLIFVLASNLVIFNQNLKDICCIALMAIYTGITINLNTYNDKRTRSIQIAVACLTATVSLIIFFASDLNNIVNIVGLILVSIAGTIGAIALTGFIIKRTKQFIVMPQVVPIELLLRFAVGLQDLSMYQFKKKEIDDFQNNLRGKKLSTIVDLSHPNVEIENKTARLNSHII